MGEPKKILNFETNFFTNWHNQKNVRVEKKKACLSNDEQTINLYFAKKKNTILINIRLSAKTFVFLCFEKKTSFLLKIERKTTLFFVASALKTKAILLHLPIFQNHNF